MEQRIAGPDEAQTKLDVAVKAPPEPRRRRIVEVKNLRKVFDDNVALDGISFHIDEGEIFGFIGPNGAGKTTTIRVLATLLEATSGEVFVDGENVFEQPERVRRVIGFMPDEFGVYEGITVWEYLDFFAGAFRVDRRRRPSIIKGVLELTDLGPHRERMVVELSKGMRQRLCLAKTLIHDPKVLILDEPASAMDPRARIELRALLKELRSMGKTILISSHILTELSDICTSYAVLEKGRICAGGDMDSLQLADATASKVHVTLQREFPEVSEILAELAVIECVELDGRRVHFEYHGQPEDFHRVIRALTERETPILTISQEGANLESLFLEVTRGELQ